MANYVESIKVGTGELWQIRDSAAHDRIERIWEVIYPIGSIYMSVNGTSPSDLFGGTWERIRDVFLLASGDAYAAGSTGGEATHTLTVDEMPNHQHQIVDAEGYQLNYNNSGETSGTGVGISRYADWNNMWAAGIGGGQPHNNMPPYLAVYMWKRTA